MKKCTIGYINGKPFITVNTGVKTGKTFYHVFPGSDFYLSNDENSHCVNCIFSKVTNLEYGKTIECALNSSMLFDCYVRMYGYYRNINEGV